MLFEWALVIVCALLFAYVYNQLKDAEHFPGFRIGGYPLGSYDPNMYPSEITREPFLPVYSDMQWYLGPEYNRYPTPNIVIYPHP